MRNIKIYLLSLGCSRNLLDSEVILGLIEKKGLKITEKAEGSDIAIVNTCAFIRSAKEESIEVILSLVELKKEKKIKGIIVTGCLSQRYPEEIEKEISQIDGIFGSSDIEKIPGAIDKILGGEKVKEVSRRPNFLYDQSYKRKILTPSHYAYLKIQEGCSNRCSYCVIPDLKGPRRSRKISSVLKEAKAIKKEHGTKELIIVGQDTTSFGIDTEGAPRLAELLRAVSPVMKDGWVRLLYTHPAHFTGELIKVIAQTDNICKYVDLPIQHINDRVLEKMNRKTRKKDIYDLIERLRQNVKDVTLRSSVIVGFPGETDGEFEELISFLRDVRFDRLGAFIYSREEGTIAASFKDQVPDAVKRERFDRVMTLQRELSAENNKKYLGRVIRVLMDDKESGRGEMDAPEVDGVIYVKGKGLKAGVFCDARVTGTMEYDLIGERL